MYGPDLTFLGIPRCDLSDVESYAGADAVILGAPFDGGTSNRPGARFGPAALRQACHLPPDGSRPSVTLRVDPLQDLKVLDGGDVDMFSGDIERSLGALEDAVYAVASAGVMPVILGGDASITLSGATGIAREVEYGRTSIVHLSAHAGTVDMRYGSLYGSGQPMRRLVESGAVRADRLLQLGLRGYSPDATSWQWMADLGMRWYDMTELDRRGLDECLSEALARAADDCDGAYLCVDLTVADPAAAPGTGTPEPGGLTSAQLLNAVRRCARDLPLVGMDLVELSPPYDPTGITAILGNRVVLELLAALAQRRRNST